MEDKTLFFKDKRISLLKSAVILASLVVFSTEFLSCFFLFTPKMVSGFWCAVMFAYVFFRRKKKKTIFPDIHVSNKNFSKTEKLILTLFLIVISVLLLEALLAPPNNYDSMTYHMSRTSHWIQNKSVDYYETHNARQLWAGPLSEYMIAQSRMIISTDILANCIQYFAMLISCIGVSWIAGFCGAKRKGQCFALFLCSTIPMGILQATSTQTDYVVAFWLVCLAVFLICYHQTEQRSFIVFAGLSLGLGLLSKGTMYIYGGVMVLFFGVLLRKKGIKPLLIIGVIALTLNISHYARNYDLGSHILSPMDNAKNLVNTDRSFKACLSLFIRNIGLHLGSPIDELNQKIEEGIESFHEMMKMDVNDPRTTLSHAFHISSSIDEDSSGNYKHFLLFVCGVLIFVFQKNLRRDKRLWVLLIYCLFSFGALIVYLKWQIWGSRLHLPVFVLLVPFMAVVFEQVNVKGLLVVLTVVFFGCSISWLTKNPKKRLFSSKKATLFNTEREGLYFITEGDLYPIYDSITGLIKNSGCRRIALDISPDDWEYPWWVMLEDRMDHFHMRHINVDNNSRKYEIEGFLPCAIIARGGKISDLNRIRFKSEEFDRVYLQEHYALYLLRKN